MDLGFMNLILLYSDHRYVSAHSLGHLQGGKCKNTNSRVCYNERSYNERMLQRTFLSIKSGCYNKHSCHNKCGGILSGDVARACAWRSGLPALNRASVIVSVIVCKVQLSVQFSYLFICTVYTSLINEFYVIFTLKFLILYIFLV